LLPLDLGQFGSPVGQRRQENGYATNGQSDACQQK
jgi:hypothetical protein